MKESKRDVETISERVFKHASKKVKLIWIAASELTITIDYGLFWLYIYIHGRCRLFYISFLTGFMICSIYCSTCSKSTKSMKPNGNISTKWSTVLYFVWEKCYFIEKLKFFHYNNIFGNVFQTSGVIDLITLLYAKLRRQKIFQLLEKVFHWKPGFHNFRVISMF